MSNETEVNDDDDFSDSQNACAPETSCVYRSHEEPMTRNCGFSSIQVKEIPSAVSNIIVTRSAPASITLNNSQTIRNVRINRKLIEIPAGDNDDSAKGIEALITGLSSTCDVQAHKKPLVRTRPNRNITAQQDASKFTFKVKSKEPEGILQTIWPFVIPPNKYYVKSNTCEKSISTVINVYSDISWSVRLDLKADDSGKFKADDVTVTYNRNGIQHEFQKIAQLVNLFVNLINILEELIGVLKLITGRPTALMNYVVNTRSVIGVASTSEVHRGVNNNFEDYNIVDDSDSNISFDIIKPQISATLSWGWERNGSTTLCHFPLRISFAADPLIGLNIRVDILTHVTTVAGPFKVFVDEVRHRFRTIRIKLMFIVNAQIGTTPLSISANLGNSDGAVGSGFAWPTMKGKLDFQLKGLAQAQGQLHNPFTGSTFYIELRGDITASTGFEVSHLTFGSDTESGLFIDYGVKWNGLKIVVAGFISGGRRIISGNSNSSRRTLSGKSYNSQREEDLSGTSGGAEEGDSSFNYANSRELWSIVGGDLLGGKKYFKDLE